MMSKSVKMSGFSAAVAAFGTPTYQP